MRRIAPALTLALTLTPALALTLALAAPAAAEEVDLELVLLADASGSIDQSEIDFQRQGYAAALTDPEVVRAITSNLTGSIAVTYVEWAANQAVVVDWMRIDGPDAVADFAARLLAPPRLAYGSNAIGAALLAGQRLIETNAFDGLRRVTDFSGDSANNRTGPALGPARDQVLAAGITINGLPILCWVCSGPANSDLPRLYGQRIIGGPGVFIVAADGTESFAAAVKRKLILEIAGRMPEQDLAAR